MFYCNKKKIPKVFNQKLARVKYNVYMVYIGDIGDVVCCVCVWVRIQQVYAPNNTLSVSYGKKKKKEQEKKEKKK